MSVDVGIGMQAKIPAQRGECGRLCLHCICE